MDYTCSLKLSVCLVSFQQSSLQSINQILICVTNDTISMSSLLDILCLDDILVSDLDNSLPFRYWVYLTKKFWSLSLL